MSVRRIGRAGRSGFAHELLLVAAAYLAYRCVRVVGESGHGRAFQHAEALLGLEHVLHIDWERGAQALALGNQAVIRVFDQIYTWMFWPWVIGALVVLYLADRGRYQVYRNALFVSGAMGLIVFALLPTAPPRMLPEFVDTVEVFSGQGAWAHPRAFANELAAMPSFHVGWTVLTGIGLASLVRRWVLRLLLLLPGVVMAVAVVVTANHYVLDGVVGVAFAAVGLRDARALRRDLPRRRPAALTAPPNASWRRSAASRCDAGGLR